MGLQEVGRYSVEPFALERILELELVKKINEHARFYVRGVLKEGEEDSLIKEQWEEKAVKLKEDGNTLFCGAAEDIGITCENGVYYLEVKAVSWTVKMDRVQRKRSFQENGMSYSSIANQLAGESGGSAVCTAPERKIQTLLLEYRETDWEFLKRLASHSGSVLVPDSRAEKPSFTFGLPAGRSYGEETGSISDFSVHKKVARYRKLSQYDWVSQETEVEEYTVRTAHASAEIGDTVSIRGKSLYVREVHVEMKGSVFLCTLHATAKSGISVEKAPHPYLSGLTLSGTVLKAVKDTVKVHLEIDLSQEAGTAYPFPYATGFSNETHTGWYVMPEEGDTVQIVFPTEEEYTAYAVQSKRQDDTKKTEDPRVKYLRTADGKEIKLDRKEILITAKDGVTLVRLHEDSGVDVFTDQEVQIISDGNITVKSEDSITMASRNDFEIHAGRNLTVTAGDSISMTCDGNNMTMLPADGISLSAEKPVRVAGDDRIDITSKGKCTIKSQKDGIRLAAEKDLTAFSNKKLSVSATSALEEYCSGSSIKLDGNINMKAALIKEN